MKQDRKVQFIIVFFLMFGTSILISFMGSLNSTTQNFTLDNGDIDTMNNNVLKGSTANTIQRKLVGNINVKAKNFNGGNSHQEDYSVRLGLISDEEYDLLYIFKVGIGKRVSIKLNVKMNQNDLIIVTGEAKLHSYYDKEAINFVVYKNDQITWQIYLHYSKMIKQDGIYISKTYDFAYITLDLNNVKYQGSESKIVGKINIVGLDDEFWVSDETVYRSFNVKIGLLAGESMDWHYEVKWGGECRVRAKIKAKADYKGDITISGTAFLFEGTYEDTLDLEDTEPINLEGSKNSPIHGKISLENNDWGCGDWADIYFNLNPDPNSGNPSDDPPDLPPPPPPPYEFP